MNETWKRYGNTVYEVSNTGYVRNSITGLILSPTTTRQGYKRLTIWENKVSRTTTVHRMMAETFLGVAEVNFVVNHKDGNPGNNRLENLEWVSIRENIKHAYATGLAAVGEDSVVSKLTEADVLMIIECMKDGMSVVQTAKAFDVSAAAISHIWNGRTWKHIARPLQSTKNYKGKLKASDIPEIRRLFSENVSDTEIAKKYGIARASVWNIRSGKNWTNY